MESRYDSDAAARMVQSFAGRAAEALALRTYTARLIGAESALVVHGGGNTSVKATATTCLGETVDALHVKGSGGDLATIEPEGHPAVRLDPLSALLRLETLSDEAMVNALRLNLLDASAPNPSVETLLHALLPARFIDHTHADAVLALADQPDGRRIFSAIFGPGLVWVPYVMPGFALAKRCAETFERVTAQTEPAVMVLEKHGLFTWGATARESYERTIEAVTRAERYAKENRRTVHASASRAEAHLRPDSVLPRLRGVCAKLSGDAPERGPIVRARSTRAFVEFASRPDASDLVAKGCITPDHVLRTKPTALLLAAPEADDGVRFAAQLESALTGYARAYDAYFEEMVRAKGVTKKKLDPWPRIVLLPGFGACAVANTAAEADVALDIYEHTIDVMATAAEVGTYEPCSRADLFDVEYWSLEQAKLKPPSPLPLSRCIALVTGAASGIGYASATRLLAAGAHVAMVDCDGDALSIAVRQPLHRYGRGRVLRIVADVRDAAAVAAAFAETVAAWGGVDVVLSNAGSAIEGRLETLQGEGALRDSLDINCMAHVAVARAAIDVMKAQGRGGCLVFNASKSAFNPGPGFGPYGVAKSALLALMRQYAIDLGPDGIRANAVNADPVRTRLFAGGVLESRAVARGLTVEQYFRANLLSREVTAEDVADAFVYLATARVTTGCVITVDGGNASAFPR